MLSVIASVAVRPAPLGAGCDFFSFSEDEQDPYACVLRGSTETLSIFSFPEVNGHYQYKKYTILSAEKMYIFG